MSRPKLTPQEKRGNKVFVYLTDTEQQMVRQMAKEMGLPITTIIRLALLEFRRDNYGRYTKETEKKVET